MVPFRLFKLIFLILACSHVPVAGHGRSTLAHRPAHRLMGPIPEIVFDAPHSVKDFPIVDKYGHVAAIAYDEKDHKGVQRAANDLVQDIERVTGIKPSVMNQYRSVPAIVIGTVGKSCLIDSLVSCGKLDVGELKGKWESFEISVLDEADERLLVIAGSDKRGTIYGIYELSEQLGVSPWYWWADVPAKKRNEAYVRAGVYQSGEPKVKYRGIFINDEWPSFGGWTTHKFGGFNSRMYTHLFELLLRLKANYLWPAMWSSAFNEDDPLNPLLADEYGIVMGTSHHEPMMRAHKEYTRRRDQIGAWNYAANKKGLDDFFIEGMTRNKDFENVVTIGMRGDGDVAMSEGGDSINMSVLRDVIAGQRSILSDIYDSEPSAIPQIWAIFTEVQRYYDAGFTVPDDVTLLFCDNNWGYIRRTGPAKERSRNGGMGMYYHIDMNGGPWNDRWVNTSPNAKIREQMNLAYKTGIDRLWIVNVGDLKPKELPIDFIMRYAWDPDRMSHDDVNAYEEELMASMFGEKHAGMIADIVIRYAKYNLWRKAEVQSPDIFSIVNHNESDKVQELWNALVADVETVEADIQERFHDAFFQLVSYPVKASAAVASIYLCAGKNNLYARQGRPSANEYAAEAKALYARDSLLSEIYNNGISGGKWKNMMLDKHIGYTRWSMPENNTLPNLEYVKTSADASLGVAVEGQEKAWPDNTDRLALPLMDPLGLTTAYIDLFDKGEKPLQYKIRTSADWLKTDIKNGTLDGERRIHVTVDWLKAPIGKTTETIEIISGKTKAVVEVPIVNAEIPECGEPYFGNLSNGEFTIPASWYNKNIPGADAKWIFIPELGRGDGDMGIDNLLARFNGFKDAPCLEYKVYIPESGKCQIALGILPTQDVNPSRGLRIATGIDGCLPSVIDARQGLVDTFQEYTPENLAVSSVLKPLPQRNTLALSGYPNKRMRNEIFDNLRWIQSDVFIDTPGFHTLKIYMVDPEIVLETICVNPDNSRQSYFGTPPVRHGRAR